MIIIDILGFIILFLIFYLAVQLIKANLLFIYVFQLKEYRLDRLKAHFKTITGRSQLFSNFNFLTWFKFFRPKLTLRSFLMLFTNLALEYHLFFRLLIFFYYWLKSYPQALFLSLFLSLLAILWLVPFLTLTSLFITGLLFLPLKLALVYYAKRKRESLKDLKVIGISGSYGKTTTKEVVSHVLKTKFKLLNTPLNCNTLLGIAFFMIKNLNKKHEIFIVEMGAYKKGEIKEICDLVKPQIGVLTGINPQHFELFGSLDNIKEAKLELIKSLPRKNSLALFNAKDMKARKLAEKYKKQKKMYGNLRVKFNSKLKPDWYQQAFQAAYILAKHFNISRKKVEQRIKKVHHLDLGAKVFKGRKGIKIIDDSYNSNPDGFEASLRLLKTIKAKRKILITPGILELGRLSDKIHKTLGKKSVLACQRIILTKKDFYQAFKKGVKSVEPEFRVELVKDLSELKNKTKKELNKNSCILLEGRMFKGFLNYLKVKNKEK